MFRAPVYESDDANALVTVGAIYVLEFFQNVDALVKGLAQSGK